MMHTPVMTCRELADFIMAYVNGELPPHDRTAFEHHLSLCANCVHYLASYKTTIELGRRAFEQADADADLRMPDELVQAILDSRKSTSSSGPRQGGRRRRRN
jgi:anti-sigma factor RsiW